MKVAPYSGKISAPRTLESKFLLPWRKESNFRQRRKNWQWCQREVNEKVLRIWQRSLFKSNEAPDEWGRSTWKGKIWHWSTTIRRHQRDSFYNFGPVLVSWTRTKYEEELGSCSRGDFRLKWLSAAKSLHSEPPHLNSEWKYAYASRIFVSCFQTLKRMAVLLRVIWPFV